MGCVVYTQPTYSQACASGIQVRYLLEYAGFLPCTPIVCCAFSRPEPIGIRNILPIFNTSLTHITQHTTLSPRKWHAGTTPLRMAEPKRDEGAYVFASCLKRVGVRVEIIVSSALRAENSFFSFVLNVGHESRAEPPAGLRTPSVSQHIVCVSESIQP